MIEERILEVNIDDLNYGGVYALIKNVIENKPNNLYIDIASIEGFRKKENENLLNKHGCKVYFIGSKKNKIVKQIYVYKNLLTLFKYNKYMCVHIHADTANKLLISGLAAKKARVNKIILHSHASGVEGKYKMMKKIMHMLCRNFLHHIGADYVSCSDLAAMWMYGTTNNVRIIKNGIDLDKYKFDLEIRKKVRKSLGIDKEILIGHIGRFSYPKNHVFMLKIAKEIKNREKSIRFIFIGDGELKDQIVNCAKKLSVSDQIIFYGTSDKVQELLQAMDVFILPSIYEGFPLVGVEAQASGLPVIFSNTLSKMVKLLPDVDFIGISDEDVTKWCDRIFDFAKIKRRDTSTDLFKAGVGIETTIDNLIKLYMQI